MFFQHLFCLFYKDFEKDLLFVFNWIKTLVYGQKL
jgi:hypothetical protein